MDRSHNAAYVQNKSRFFVLSGVMVYFTYIGPVKSISVEVNGGSTLTGAVGLCRVFPAYTATQKLPDKVSSLDPIMEDTRVL